MSTFTVGDQVEIIRVLSGRIEFVPMYQTGTVIEIDEETFCVDFSGQVVHNIPTQNLRLVRRANP